MNSQDDDLCDTVTAAAVVVVQMGDEKCQGKSLQSLSFSDR